MSRYALIEAPTSLGLGRRGVERLPAALQDAGLADALGDARLVARVEPPAPERGRLPPSGIRNGGPVATYSVALADAVGSVLDSDEWPVVLGGDCSILLGTMLSLRRRGRYGLLFVDGHADFYQPEAEPNGEIASMDLALATGRGPGVLTDLEGLRPLVRDADVVQLGRRDGDEAAAAGSQRIEDSDITLVDLATIRHDGAERAVADALVHLSRPDLDGFWIHLDCDVIDDDLMPAVDYRLPGGLSWDELALVLRRAVSSGGAVGLEVTIYNPDLDPRRTVAQRLVQCLGEALSP